MRDGFRADHRRKRDLLGDGLRAAGFRVYQPRGTYFITTDITQVRFAFCKQDDVLTEAAGRLRRLTA